MLDVMGTEVLGLWLQCSKNFCMQRMMIALKRTTWSNPSGLVDNERIFAIDEPSVTV